MKHLAIQTRLLYRLVPCLALLIQFGCSRPCTKTLDQAPELRGFRLGTPISEIQSRFNKNRLAFYPAFPIFRPNRFGFYQVLIVVEPVPESLPNYDYYVVSSSPYYPEFNGTRSIVLQFVDAKLAGIKVYYRDDLNWQSVDEFVKQIAQSLDLPNGWEAPKSSEDYRHCYCAGFFVRAGRDSEEYNDKKLPFVEVGNTLDAITPVFRQMNGNQDEEKQQEQRRREFKP